LYAANFRSGAVDVFDANFHPVHRPGAFTDPALPRGFTPFNVHAVGDTVYVTYTKNNNGRYDSDAGLGDGYVDALDTQGRLLRRVAGGGPLDAPWGIALAPGGFGEFANDLLVGNFADGRINAFDPQSGAFRGSLTDAADRPIVLPGLWGLLF